MNTFVTLIIFFANKDLLYFKKPNQTSLQTNMGGKENGDVEAEAMPEGFGSSFSDRNIRMKFVRKVYSILLIQLLVTTAIIAVFILSPVRGLMCDNG